MGLKNLLGRVEVALTEQMFTTPQHDYSRDLVSITHY
ncbi:hypothetical protein VIBNIFTn2_120122 [Vibrio nigripulchritudo FTn2]|nr:hypothetical protein VIBNIFTn2_120122 [Vibrio nigripulchritudo FTn2]